MRCFELLFSSLDLSQRIYDQILEKSNNYSLIPNNQLFWHLMKKILQRAVSNH